MKKTRFIILAGVIFCAIRLHAAPRFPFPSTPDEVGQNDRDLSDQIEHHVDASTTTITITGEIRMYGGSSAPTGWYICDGTAKSRTTDSALYAVIGTTFGIGDGSTTFNLPDFQSRQPIGVGTGSGLSARALAATGGAETHVHTISHRHTAPSGQSLDGFSLIPDKNAADGWAQGTEVIGVSNHARIQPAGAGTSASSQQTWFKTRDSDTANSGSTSSMSPFLAINFIIKK